jgi:hypothetical protein
MHAGRALLALALALASAALLSCACARARPALPYICDPAWSGAFSGDMAAVSRGFGRSGREVLPIAYPMTDLPNGLNALIASRKERVIALSPLIGSDLVGLHAVFPDKTFIVPGLDAPEGSQAYGSRSDTAQALEILGHMAAKAVQKGKNGSSAAIRYAAAVFLSGPAGDAQKADFSRGFEAESPGSGLGSLLVRVVAEDKAEAVAAITELSGYDVKFVFLSAGSVSSAVLDAVPERGWTVAGLRLKDLSGTHPSLAASVEDDWEGLGRQALALTEAKGGSNAAVPARIIRLPGDRGGLFSNFKR